jgi:hypothetical protein
MLRNNFILLVTLVLLNSTLFSQGISPEAKISVCEGYVSAKKALQILESKYQTKFAYNPTGVNLEREIYLCKRNTSITDIVSLVVGFKVMLIPENNHLIIKRIKGKNLRQVTISGRVEDAENGQPLRDISIDIAQAKSKTNSLGYFSITIESDKDTIDLEISANDYQSIRRRINFNEPFLRLMLNPIGYNQLTTIPILTAVPAPRIEDLWITRAVVNQKQVYISETPENLYNKNFQVSLLPNLGFYLLKSGLYKFKGSLNLIAGYVGGVDGVELGLGVNAIRNNLNGLQLAGLANVVGGNVSGLQASFLNNTSIGRHNGAQISAISNVSWGKFSGGQFCLGLNIARSKFTGVQMAPVNITIDTIRGAQLGLVNIATSVSQTAQISIYNYAHINKHFQLAFLNSGKNNNAFQLALLNICKNQNGFQLGVINCADTVSGLSVGIINIVKNGYTHLDYSYTTGRFANIVFKTGAHRFYNLIDLGVRPDNMPDFKFGYGFGFQKTLSKRFGVNYDFSVSHIIENNKFDANLNLISQQNVNISYSITKRFAIICGFQLNELFTNIKDFNTNANYSSIPETLIFLEKQHKTFKTYIWPEATIGVRF